jgi:hypothetical protein
VAAASTAAIAMKKVGVNLLYTGKGAVFAQLVDRGMEFYLKLNSGRPSKRQEDGRPVRPALLREPAPARRAARTPLVTKDGSLGRRARPEQDVGDDHFLYASDAPHWDGEFPKNLKYLWNHPDLSQKPREDQPVTRRRSILN